MAEGGGLRRHPVGVRRHRRVGFGLRQLDQRLPCPRHAPRHAQPTLPGDHAPRRAVQVLPRAAQVDVRGLDAGQLDQPLFDVQVVAGALGAGAGLLLVDPLDGVGDGSCQRGR